MTPQDDLAAFLTARLDEDEAAAKAALLRAHTPWIREALPASRTPGAEGITDDVTGNILAVTTECGIGLAEHIARHDPARVLREVAAKRAILAQWHDGNTYGPDRNFSMRVVVETLAAVYGDHPAG